MALIELNFFKEICTEIGKRYWFEFDALGTDEDHVHVFVGAAPRYTPSRVMQIIKSITAKTIFKKLHNFIMPKITGNS
ncbi:MAG: Transposase IS200 like protein [Candidatus Argoarchaeum ethanivorans]|uniref:Transposase IS200 like protein n=1 Tax=Candidatus Argoarchaeum ethanivorans TaxID=2608793 RepID=A0A811T7C4_9EURY|nr:MAG: Transposase IS200 like protein [Candidatus Argoarchaeum ethanivorans]